MGLSQPRPIAEDHIHSLFLTTRGQEGNVRMSDKVGVTVLECAKKFSLYVEGLLALFRTTMRYIFTICCRFQIKLLNFI